MAKTARDSFKFMLRLPDDLREALKGACEQSGRSMTAEIIARLEASFEPSSGFSDDQLRALKGLAASFEWQQAKLEIDTGHAVATMREVTTLLKSLMNSPADLKAQAVLAGMRVIENVATYLGRPYVYRQMMTSRFVDETPPRDPLAEVIATAEWVTEQLLHEFRRVRDYNVRPQA